MARRATGRWLTLAFTFVALPCASAEEPPPSLELLLHLAEFSDASGEPIAPEDAAAMMEAPAASDASRPDLPPPDPATPRKRAARAAAPEDAPHDRD